MKHKYLPNGQQTHSFFITTLFGANSPPYNSIRTVPHPLCTKLLPILRIIQSDVYSMHTRIYIRQVNPDFVGQVYVVHEK